MAQAKQDTGSKPSWLKTPLPKGKVFFDIRRDVKTRRLATVCEEARCPNIGQCWESNTATFMLLGDTCTRACRFCHIKTAAKPQPPNPSESQAIALSCKQMKLKYVVMTMVDRDDLEDGGASHVARVVTAVKETCPEITVEILAGDFAGKISSIEKLISCGVAVYAHNIETVARLTPRVRDARASYRQSLRTLGDAKKLAKSLLYTKSSLMLGLGENSDEVEQAMLDLRSHDVDFITLGQYMRPSKKHLPVKEWIHPDRFEKFAEQARKLGFLAVAAAPLMRSSFRASEVYAEALKRNS